MSVKRWKTCQVGVSRLDSTVTYRLNQYGLKARRTEGLVDKRSGEPFLALLDRGEYQVPAETEAVPA